MSADTSVYRELAELYQQQGQSQLRDRFLLLAAQSALEGGNAAEADRLRQRLLQFNPHHMIKPFASFADAMRSPDVQSYVRDLKQSYPLATAHQMLAGLRQASLHPTPVASPPAAHAAPAPYRMLPPATLPRAPIGASAARPGALPPRGLRPTTMLTQPGNEPQQAAWLATGLFFLVLLLGIGVAGYTLARPFLN